MTPYFRELMLRAPAIPDWFMQFDRNEPAWKQGFISEEMEKHLEKRVMAWPSYYASEVIKAAGWEGDPKDLESRRRDAIAKESIISGFISTLYPGITLTLPNGQSLLLVAP